MAQVKKAVEKVLLAAILSSPLKRGSGHILRDLVSRRRGNDGKRF